MNYKQNFTNLENPEALFEDIDEELAQELTYDESEETKQENFYYGFNMHTNKPIPEEITKLFGCGNPCSEEPTQR
jgi:hypothetical protein